MNVKAERDHEEEERSQRVRKYSEAFLRRACGDGERVGSVPLDIRVFDKIGHDASLRKNERTKAPIAILVRFCAGTDEYGKI